LKPAALFEKGEAKPIGFGTSDRAKLGLEDLQHRNKAPRHETKEKAKNRWRAGSWLMKEKRIPGGVP